MSLIDKFVEEGRDRMEKSVAHSAAQMGKIRAGTASTDMVEGVMVEYYGAPKPIDQIASVTTLDTRTILIKPWDKSMVAEIEKAIRQSDLGLTTQDAGDAIRVHVPAMTEERRAGLVKQVRAELENAKVQIRNIRKETNESLRVLDNEEGISSDMIKDGEGQVQSHTDSYSKKMEEFTSNREKEIMRV